MSHGASAGAPTVLDDELRQLLLQLSALDGRIRLPFLVTLAPGVVAGDAVPFEPTLEVALTRLVCGEMTPGQALDLAQHPGVERIEYDGEARALRQRLRPGP